MRVHESGLKQHWKDHAHKYKYESAPEILGINEFRYVFYLWIIGLLVASTVFVLEVAFSRRYQILSYVAGIMRNLRKKD